MSFVRSFSGVVRLFCLVALGTICLLALAQDATPVTAHAKETPAVAMPSDPRELMLLAAKTNGLTGDDVKPWHVKITFQSGQQAAEHGTIEEWWSSDKHYKIAITSTHFEQTEYGTESGILRSGVRGSAPSILVKMRNDILHPIPLRPEQLGNLKIKMRARKIGEAMLSCLSVDGSTPATAEDAIKPYTYCLDSDLPVLRMRIYPGSVDRHIYNHIVRFQNRYIAKEIEYAFGGLNGQKPGAYWTAQIDVLETLTPADAKEFDPPAGTLPAIKTVTVAEKDSKLLLLDHPKPVYPPIAIAVHVTGSVVLHATVEVDGRIRELVFVSGPLMLQQAAFDAAKRYTFKPYMVDGDAAEMETTITVPFTLRPGELPN